MKTDFLGNELNIGDEVPNSYEWEDGEYTDEELDGTSTTGIKDLSDESIRNAFKLLSSEGYQGKKIALIGGEVGGSGRDAGELVIQYNEILDIFNKDISPLQKAKDTSKLVKKVITNKLGKLTFKRIFNPQTHKFEYKRIG